MQSKSRNPWWHYLARNERVRRRARRSPALLAVLSWSVLAALAPALTAQLVFSELMYHPVEKPAFNPDGSPVMELYEDVHEFVEIHNRGTLDITLTGYALAGGIRYSFPSNAVIRAGGFLVIARDPDRLAKLSIYALRRADLFGPYEGQLGNRRDTVRLRDAKGTTLDSVSYSAEFPWAIAADGLGAGEKWTGLRDLDYQYRGRSLERVSFTHAADDPANWLASPLPGNPSPGRANAVQLPVPRPVVTTFSVTQAADESNTIRAEQPVRIDCAFSGSQALSNVRIESFVDDINATNEVRTILAMQAPDAGAARFTATLPGRPSRSVVRFRFLANRGAGDEVVSPRADDPYGWHAYFVSPVRNASRPVYDCFISTASLARLASNISQSPRRVTSPDPPGTPRASWNASEPAIMVHEGIVYDIFMRHHGSRYNRSAGRNSFKWYFPRYRKFNGVSAIFETDKGNDFIVGHGLFRDLGFPVSSVRYVDLYLNNQGAMQRLEQGEYDEDMLAEFHQRQQAENPGAALEPAGEIYKTVGTIDQGGEGPYGRGDARKLSRPPYWTDLQMYDWTYALQNHGWRGSYSFKQMLDAFWVARGDTPSRPNPNVPAVRQFFLQHFDIEQMLNHTVLENWCCPWDHTTQNHFFWQRRNGKWGMLPWDMDAWYGRGDNTPATSSIFIGEVGDPNNNFRGPNFIKDGFIKAFRQELKERFFLWNNTVLHPDNIRAMGYGSIYSFAQQRFASVNQQCGLGVFQRPVKPAASAPRGNVTALPPASLETSAYGHTASPARPHLRTVWEIRDRQGSYSAPVWKTTDTTNLVSIPIPFDRLRFGETYYWRSTHVDADGHPSVASDEAGFTFGPAPRDVRLVAIDSTTPWKFDESKVNRAGTPWTALDFNDAAWRSGAPLLARETAALPEPIRTPLTLGATTYYFRHQFNFPGSPQGAQVKLNVVIDDGCVVYLNGVEVLRLRMPAGAVTYDTFASQNVGDAVYEGPFDIPAQHLTAGENVLAVEVHQSNASSSDVVFGLTLDATLAAVTGEVLLHEVAARNTGSVTVEGRAPDWIELFNSGSETVDLGGMSLSDNVLKPAKFVFPGGTLLAPQAYLVVWCDAATHAPGLHTGFGLSAQGQTVALFGPAADGPSVRDYLSFGLQLPDLTIGRVGGGKGSWQLTHPTPGQANTAHALAPATGLKVNEWMASPRSGSDWFEIFNPAPLPVALGGLYLTDDRQNPTNSLIPALSFIGARDYTQFFADEDLAQGADHVGFRLNANGESLALYAANGSSLIDAVAFGVQVEGVSQGRLPDGADALVDFPASASPGESNYRPLTTVVVNEVLAHSDAPFEDAIELYNPGTEPVDVGGWWLSDSRRDPRKYRMPTGTTLSAQGFAVIYEYQFNAETNASGSFALSSARGDEVVVSEADAQGNLTGYRHHVTFGASANGVSLGRFPTSRGFDFTALAAPTFGEDQPLSLEQFRQGRGRANAAAKVGPVVMSEIMYQPPLLGTNDNTRDEFIELHNLSAEPVPLYDPQHPENTWRLRDAIDFDFPSNEVLSAGESLVVVSFDPIKDAERRTQFESVYGPVGRLLGPFQRKLGNADDSVELYSPDSPQTLPGPDFGVVPYIRVDRVRYSSAPPWPSQAAGTGLSLNRRQAYLYGNDPVNWQAAVPTPGRYEAQIDLGWRLGAALDATGGLLSLQAMGQGDATLILQRSEDLLAWRGVTTNRAVAGIAVFDPIVVEDSRSVYFRCVLPSAP